MDLPTMDSMANKIPDDGGLHLLSESMLSQQRADPTVWMLSQDLGNVQWDFIKSHR